MKSGMLALAALVAIALTGAARGGFGLAVPSTSPAPKRPAAMGPVSDPAEPPLKVEVSSGTAGVAVASGAKGTAVRFSTPGSYQGSAGLTFKNAAPPMRLTLTLANMPNYDLASLTLASGSLSLAVGPVTAAPATRYFDARGRAMAAPEGAAYTVTARRWDGELDVQLRRAPGAAMGKALTVSWQGNLIYGDFWGKR